MYTCLQIFSILNTFFETYFHQNYVFLTSGDFGIVYTSHYCLQKLKTDEKNFKMKFFLHTLGTNFFCSIISLSI